MGCVASAPRVINEQARSTANEAQPPLNTKSLTAHSGKARTGLDQELLDSTDKLAVENEQTTVRDPHKEYRIRAEGSPVPGLPTMVTILFHRLRGRYTFSA